MGWPATGGVDLGHLVGCLAIHSTQATALFRFTNNEKDPVLSVAARGSPDRCVENLGDQFFRYRIGFQPAQCASAVDRIEYSKFAHHFAPSQRRLDQDVT